MKSEARNHEFVQARKRCNQCWKKRLLKFFAKPGVSEFRTLISANPGQAFYQDCATCRAARASGKPYRAKASRRRRIDAHELKVLVADTGQNSKLGNIPSTYTSGRTCPDACVLKNGGCYAEFGFVRMHWQKMKGSLDWANFLGWVIALPSGTLWRHNVAGDLPGDGDKLEVAKLFALGTSASHTKGFTFTHKPLRTAREQAAIQCLNHDARSGFGLTTNLSADTLAEADAKSDLEIGPVVVTVPADFPRFGKTPAGRKVMVCPAQVREDITCERCKLCANANRTSIVAFRAHGQWGKQIDKRYRQLPLVGT